MQTHLHWVTKIHTIHAHFLKEKKKKQDFPDKFFEFSLVSGYLSMVLYVTNRIQG